MLSPETARKFNKIAIKTPSQKVELPSYGDVKLEIYNTLGEKVRTLLQTHQPAGNYKVQWDGCNDTGTKVSTGIYFYELTALGTKMIRKLLLLQ